MKILCLNDVAMVVLAESHLVDSHFFGIFIPHHHCQLEGLLELFPSLLVVAIAAIDQTQLHATCSDKSQHAVPSGVVLDVPVDMLKQWKSEIICLDRVDFEEDIEDDFELLRY